MARHEQEREDLLAEATALVERMELGTAEADPVVMGVRRDGCLSLYFGQDPAYHFNTHGELRRAFISGRLVKAEQRRLVSLTRQRTADAVQLLAETLTDEQAARCCDDLQRQVDRLRVELDQGACRVLRRFPDDLPALQRAAEWLRSLPAKIVVAVTPHAR